MSTSSQTGSFITRAPTATTATLTSWPRPANASVADWLTSLTPPQREAALREIAPSPRDEAALEHSWDFWGRPKQHAPPGNWNVWLVLAGRGFGKTLTGAQWVRRRVEREGARHLALVGATAADVRDVMVEGPCGILAVSPKWNKPKYEPSKRRLTWQNGATATLFSAEEPERLRGPQYDTLWADELGAWKYCEETWFQTRLGIRLGEHYGVKARTLVTTTPRPIPTVRAIIADSLVEKPSSVVTRGSTYENQHNLDADFIRELRKKYEGTRLGRQEIEAEMLDDVPGALWTRARLDELRVHLKLDEFGIAESPKKLRARLWPLLKTVIVAVDPAVSVSEDSNETGIIVAALGYNGHGYVLADASGKYSPGEWAQKVVDLVDEWEADRVVAEKNQGGDLVASNIRTVRRALRITTVHAARGKATRAGPVAALDEQGRIHHVGSFPQLEDQLCTWVPDSGEDSPDRLDARVWAFTDLMVDRDPDRKSRKPAALNAEPLDFEDRSIG